MPGRNTQRAYFADKRERSDPCVHFLSSSALWCCFRKCSVHSMNLAVPFATMRFPCRSSDSRMCHDPMDLLIRARTVAACFTARGETKRTVKAPVRAILPWAKRQFIIVPSRIAAITPPCIKPGYPCRSWPQKNRALTEPSGQVRKGNFMPRGFFLPQTTQAAWKRLCKELSFSWACRIGMTSRPLYPNFQWHPCWAQAFSIVSSWRPPFRNCVRIFSTVPGTAR